MMKRRAYRLQLLTSDIFDKQAHARLLEEAQRCEGGAAG
jgi:hypothetical protein